MANARSFMGNGVVVSALLLTAGASAAVKVDFNRDIRPILSNKCARCHGPDESQRKADLRLDVEKIAKQDLGGYAAIVPGDVQKSELIHRVTATDEDEVMPPKGKGDRLKPAEVELLSRWIQEGAPYAAHWSYVKPVRPGLPAVSDKGWPKNSIDHFILSRLDREGLKPSPEADKRTLVRRIALDLTGLPPTPAEVSAYLEDQSATAYEKMVDRFLAKESFGEHWARPWLDLARYADSAGYPSDPGRTIWIYRDWVIKSLNQNLPFDEFTIDQIAGDLLPNPTDDQLVATAFHRNTMTQNEGGTSDEEFRSAAVVDRVNTTLAVWMGTSMACAQCHSHKYDPITQEEYFRVYAILNNSADADKKDESPLLEIYTPEQRAQKATWEKEAAGLKTVLAKGTPELAAEQVAWEKSLSKEPAWRVIQPGAVSAQSNKLAVDKDGTITASQKPAKDVYTIELPIRGNDGALPSIPVTALRLETLAGGNNFAITQVSAQWVPAGAKVRAARFVRVELPGDQKMIHLAEVEVFSGGQNVARQGKASQISTDYNAPAERAIDGKTSGEFKNNSVTHTAVAKDPWWEVDLGAAKPLERVVLWNRTDGGDSIPDRLKGFRILLLDEKRETVWEQAPEKTPKPSAEFTPTGIRGVEFAAAFADFEQSGFAAANVLQKELKDDKAWSIGPATSEAHFLTLIPKNPIPAEEGKLIFTIRQESKFPEHVLTGFRIAGTDSAQAAAFAKIPKAAGDGLRIPAEKRSPVQLEAIAAYFRTVAPSLKDERDQLAKLEKNLADYKPFTSVPVMRDLAEKERRKTHLQIRGNYLALGPEVTEGTPAVFPPLPPGQPLNRLALAKWLVSPENPLTSRVLVNRIWDQIFGAGIVRTSEEFGSQGEGPFHPELLDWLAVEIQETGWKVKDLVRLYVTSAAYRQSSRVTPELVERDPENRLLARGPRFRASGELLRDQALYVSGLLSPKMYGPAVRPARPALGLTTAFGGNNDWETSQGEDRYRRSVYTEVRRNSPYPSFATFDAPNREVCTIRRDRTNTPLQAFVTLNDPVFVEAAQGLARRIVKDGGAETRDRLRFAYEVCLSRPPTDRELGQLMALYEEVRASAKADRETATALATDPLGPAPAGADVVELAAWSTVANVILNLDEVLMRL